VSVSRIVHAVELRRRATFWVLVAAGGGCGAIARAGFERAETVGPGDFPWPTLSINLTGAFLLGWAATRQLAHPDPLRKAFLASGFCGGLTTFATMQEELVRLVDGGHGGTALAYAAASLAGGLLVAFLGAALARRTLWEEEVAARALAEQPHEPGGEPR
jgi:fluoride exporter